MICFEEKNINKWNCNHNDFDRSSLHNDRKNTGN